MKDICGYTSRETPKDTLRKERRNKYYSVEVLLLFKSYISARQLKNYFPQFQNLTAPCIETLVAYLAVESFLASMCN
ncbi:RNA pyrophosphohydrolase [Dirofilaria immitis]